MWKRRDNIMKKKAFVILGLCLFALLVAPVLAVAQEDVPDSKDHPLLTRMPNFYISSYKDTEFDQADFKNSKGEDITVEGHKYEIIYSIKEGKKTPSELQILRNYENAVRKIGGSLVYEASPDEAWLKVKNVGKIIWIDVLTGCEGGCYELTIVEEKKMVQEVVANAISLAKDISSTGHASVYGIYFDFDKADIKPESEPAIKEIAKLIQDNKELKLYVVGHTDNVGTIDYNMKLSKARADAVMKELITKYNISSQRLKAYGIGSLAPVASNKTDEGRAKNRRVELVEQ
jgi:OOP family OmpA-OmpF porin